MEFQLNGEEYIELNKLLKTLQMVGSGGEANVRIVTEEVKVNGAIEIQKRKKVRAGDIVEFQKTKIKVKE